MSSAESNSNEPAPPGAPRSSPRGSALLVAVTLALLAWLVWASRPIRPPIAPAPLRTLPAGCPKKAGDFIPSNFTDAPGVSWQGLSDRQRNRALLRLNMEVCPCGCNVSVAECLNTHPPCDACKASARRILDEEKAAP